MPPQFESGRLYCRYHAKTSSIGCKKRVGVLDGSVDARGVTSRIAKIWALQHASYGRQSDHIDFEPEGWTVPACDTVIGELARSALIEAQPKFLLNDVVRDLIETGMSAHEAVEMGGELAAKAVILCAHD